MNQQPPAPEQNNGGVGQQNQQRIVLQPLQIHSLTESYRAEIAKANEVGNQTEEGQEHLKRARRIRLILLRFQEQQRLQRQQLQNGGATNSQPGSSNTPTTSHQGTPVAQSLIPAPVSRQPSLQNVSQQQSQAQRLPQQLQMPQQPQQQQQQPQLQGQQQIQQQLALNLSGRLTPSQQLQFQLRQGSQTTPVPQQLQPLQQQTQSQQLQPNASILQLQKIRKILDDFHGRLRAIENTKRSGTLGPEELARLVQQEELLKQRYDQYTRAAVQMSQQFQLRRAQLAAAAGNTPLAGSPAAQSLQLNLASPTGLLIPILQQQQSQLQLQQQGRATFQRTNSQQALINTQTQQQQQQMLLLRLQQQQQQQQRQSSGIAPRSNLQTPVGQQQQQQIQVPDNNANVKRASVNLNTQQRTPASGGRSASPGQSSTPVTTVNALARPSAPAHAGSGLGGTAVSSVVKSPVPTIPISSTINVQPPAPTVMKGSRPSVTGGGAFNSLALTQPATYKLPQFEMEGDRVLHKRKLKELVRSIGSDEGDGETTIDGDVEELLLDLADEFVTNVTSFACRLAKHRKVDNIDVKDIQLHLEKNWNIRIPGYSSDEIRSTRRFQPTPGHNQKIAGVEIARSVKKDGN